jgi:FKBP-type peptidyl-prolyl cis-trans isomerase SlyD
MDYTLRDDDGDVIDESSKGEPLEFLHGHGQIIPGLESELLGMKVGDSKKVTVLPGDAYGDHDPEKFQAMPRSAFPPDLELEEGIGLHMRDANSGEVYQVFVDEVREDEVLLDFNHPLAGETLHFEVTISGLRAATSDELAHGHAHGPDGHH